MRIAISGSHRVGKTTLAEALVEALPGYDLILEPYRLLEAEGHTFADPPSVEDFGLQLERSLQSLHEAADNAIFDRCPLDIIGYLVAHPDGAAFPIDDWMAGGAALGDRLDLIVFVGIEAPDRIAVPSEEDALRADVDRVLRDIILDDAYDLEIDTLEVAGTEAERLQQVVRHLGRRPEGAALDVG